MTWQMRDALPRQRLRGKAGVPEPQGTAAEPDPVKVPTYARSQEARLTLEDETPFRFTAAQERELMAEGIWPERDWSIWKHAMVRGVREE